MKKGEVDEQSQQFESVELISPPPSTKKLSSAKSSKVGSIAMATVSEVASVSESQELPSCSVISTSTSSKETAKKPVYSKYITGYAAQDSTQEVTAEKMGNYKWKISCS